MCSAVTIFLELRRPENMRHATIWTEERRCNRLDVLHQLRLGHRAENAAISPKRGPTSTIRRN